MAIPDPAAAHMDTLHEVVEHLAAIERAPGSPGEAQAATWLGDRLTAAGCEVTIDAAEYLDGYAKPIGTMAAAAAVSGLLALAGGRRTRKLSALLAGAATVGIADDISNGPRIVRHLTKPCATQNVVALTGDLSAERTLVVMGHHDAAPTGKIFDDSLQVWFGERFPGLIERVDTSLPLWWLVLAGPALVALGAAHNRRGKLRAGTAAATLATALLADIASSPTVPGANDNLSANAVQVALAERLQKDPISGLRVMIVSCGAEEVIQGGIYSFAERHFPRLDRERTWFLNMDTVGSPILALVEGEGPVLMEDYHDVRFRDRVAQAAVGAGTPLRRGMRARNSTDAVIPSRAGYPTATLVSFDRYKALSNYHMMSDTAENLNYHTLAQALVVAEATARSLSSDPWI